MIITGRIFEIIEENDMVALIVIRKKVNNKVVPVALKVFGYWKDKCLKGENKLVVRDKIRANVYLKSKLYKEKYYTDVFLKEIFVIEPAPVKFNELFQQQQPQEDFDEDTGEVFLSD